MPGFRVYLQFTFWLLLVTAAGAADESPEALLAQGDALLMRDAYQDAIEEYLKGVALLTGEEPPIIPMSLHTNLGTAQYALDLVADAGASYQSALLEFKRAGAGAEDPDGADGDVDLRAVAASASFYLGMVYQDQEAAQDAIDAYELAVQLDPLHWSAQANLGSVYQDLLVQHEKALAAYNRAYLLLVNADQVPPTDLPREPRFTLSQLQYRIGVCIQHFADGSTGRACAVADRPDAPADCRELAAHAFALALEYDPDNEAARHMLATLTADASMRRASNAYVRSLFDDYARNFEHSLVRELGYTGYERLRRAFDRSFGGQPPVFERVMDAGMGTGLAGEQFRNVSRHLLGVDLSQRIIDEALAVRPGLYDDTVAGDLIEVLRQRAPFSLIVAADSYIYFGDLDPLFAAMDAGLGTDGYAAFTLENVGVDDEAAMPEGWRWQLTPSGRFAHRRSYVEAVAAEHQLTVTHYEELDSFRYERGVGVRGHVFVVQKRGSPNDEL